MVIMPVMPYVRWWYRHLPEPTLTIKIRPCYFEVNTEQPGYRHQDKANPAQFYYLAACFSDYIGWTEAIN